MSKYLLSVVALAGGARGKLASIDAAVEAVQAAAASLALSGDKGPFQRTLDALLDKRGNAPVKGVAGEVYRLTSGAMHGAEAHKLPAGGKRSAEDRRLADEVGQMIAGAFRDAFQAWQTAQAVAREIARAAAPAPSVSSGEGSPVNPQAEAESARASEARALGELAMAKATIAALAAALDEAEQEIVTMASASAQRKRKAA